MFVVWGKIMVLNAPEIKLIAFDKRTSAVQWIQQNRKYYNDMTIKRGGTQ